MRQATIIKKLNELELLAYTWKDGDLVEAHIPPTVIERDGSILVTSEDGHGFIDYYGEFRGGYPYIHKDLETWAETNGFYWEWEHPGAIALVHD